MADNSKELIKNNASAEEELQAFNTDVKLADLQDRIERGDLSQDEKDCIAFINGQS